MNYSQLSVLLNQQYSTSGSIDVSQLEDASYTTQFELLGIPFVIQLADATEAGWFSVTTPTGTGLKFQGSIAGESTVLGRSSGSTLAIEFIPDGNDVNVFTLQLTLFLTSDWRFGQSFELLSTSLYDEIELQDQGQGYGSLVVTAAQAILAGTVPTQPLWFSGSINQNSSIFTVMTWFISGGIQNPVSGPIHYTAATGYVEMNLPLSQVRIEELFAHAIEPVTLSLSLWSGLVPALGAYNPGILFETNVQFGDSPISLNALFTNPSLNYIALTVEGLSLNLAAAESAISQYFSDTILSELLPDSISTAVLVISDLTFQISLSDLSLIEFSMSATTTEQTIWDIWPGLISLSALQFSFAVISPFTDDITYDFEFSGLSTFGGDGGLPLLVQGNLPGLEITASLAGEPYNLNSFLTYFFGTGKNLPDDLVISELLFHALLPENTYSFTLDITGNWAIPFGTANLLVLEEIRVHLAWMDGLPHGTVFMVMQLATSIFAAELNLSYQNQSIYGTWSDPDNPIDYIDLAIKLGMYGLPDLPDNIDLNLTDASFELETAGPSISFTLTSATYGSAALLAGRDADQNWGFVFGMVAGLDLSVNLTDIDVVGNFVPEGLDTLSVNNLRFVGATAALPIYTPTPELDSIFGSEINSGLVLSIDLNIGTLFSETFTVRFGGLDDGTAADTPPQLSESGSENNGQSSGDVQLDAPPPTTTAQPGPTSTWIAVQRAFGPVHINRIGFRITETNALGLLLDADVKLAGLTIGLNGLEADIPIQAPFWPSFSLAGLEVGYIAPGLTLAGGLQKAFGVSPAQYTGELILQAGSFGASAFGSYTTVNGDPSLFAFLAVNAPLGGPPFCVVTGLSLGFGYNRQLILPDITNVQSYPLVQAAMGITDPQATIAALDRYIVPAENQYWLAAGIRFTSFEMLNAYAMLTASFGTQVELALMGEGLLTLPIAVPGEQATILAQADMVLLASINPSLGQLAVNAQLTSRSYILDRNAQLTGGFALYFWFGNSAHKGDFVITLGGYNPHFTKPDYYPSVPQLGLNWKISDLISIKGGLYCALTPGVIMAGGLLNASYTSGNVRAWFTANADFLIRFKPFSFSATLAVSVGASYTLNLHFTTKTISVTAGASLRLWGPPFAGTATVDLGVISFTMAFGAAQLTTVSAITWSEFRNSFLPPEPRQDEQPLQLDAATSVATQSLTTFSAERGLISSSPANELGDYGAGLPANSTAWRLDPGRAAVVINNAIPSHSLSVLTATFITPDLAGVNTTFGIGPMSAAADTVVIVCLVQVFYNNLPDSVNTWQAEVITDQVPAGLWLNTSNSMTGPPLVNNALTGIRLRPVRQQTDVMQPVALEQLMYAQEPATRDVRWSSAYAATADSFNQANAMAVLQGTIIDPGISSLRASMLDVLQAQGLTVYSGDELQLDRFAEQAPELLIAAPQLRYTGETA